MRFVIPVIFFVCVGTLLPAQRVVVTSPVEGETWNLGEMKWITWDANGFTGTVQVEMVQHGGGDSCCVPSSGPLPPATDEKIKWKVGYQAADKPLLSPGVYDLCIYHLGGNNDGDWSKIVHFTIRKGLIIPQSIIFRLPQPGNPCTLCPEFDLKPLGEIYYKMNSPLRLVLIRDGQQVQELGSYAMGSLLPAVLEAKLSQKNFDLLKGGNTAFALAVLDGKGKVLSRHKLRPMRQLASPLNRR